MSWLDRSVSTTQSERDTVELVDLPFPSGPILFISNRKDTADDSIVIPLSCSSSLESKNLSFPAIREDMMLFDESSESANDVLP